MFEDECNLDGLIPLRAASKLDEVLTGLWYYVAARWDLTAPERPFFGHLCELYPWHLLIRALIEAWNMPDGYYCEYVAGKTELQDGKRLYLEIVRDLQKQQLEERLGASAFYRRKARRGSGQGGGKPDKKNAA